MSLCFYYYKIFLMLAWTKTVKPMSVLNKSYLMTGESDSDIAEYISSKGYLPNEMVVPKFALVNSGDNDVTYLLSKLPDEELLKLLNEQPNNNEYYLNDVVRLALDSKSTKGNNASPNDLNNANKVENQKQFSKLFRTEQNKPTATFRLENKLVDPFSHKHDIDPKYVAVQKLNNMLYNHPLQNFEDKDVDDEEKKELLFDILVAQLKSLCCKKNKSSKSEAVNMFPFETLLPELNTHDSLLKPHVSDYKATQNGKKMPNEHMFLIINNEIKSNGSEELITVDPDSLENNSSVLLLGPITTPLTEAQLKLVMRRISYELAKIEYLPLLQQLSEGKLNDQNVRLMKSLITGPKTRRYIKPHRCNHQSKLAKIYGGPKWLICTGYLNLNTPSLYD